MYFDGNDGHDLSLLDSDVRTHAEVERVAERVEEEIIALYTERGSTDLYSYTVGIYTYSVMLRGYQPVLADADGYNADRTQWTGFAKAFRQTVADVTSHRLRGHGDHRGMKSERIDGYAYERWDRADPDWPGGWSLHLRRYDERTPVFI